MGRAWGCLQERSDFLRAAAKGVRRSTPAFLMQAVRREEPGPLRLGLTASRKIGNAVARNRAKRRLRALADAVLPPLIGAGVDMVLVARHDVLARDFAVMTDELRRAAAAVLRQIGPGERPS